MTRKILLVQHTKGTPPGLTPAWLNQRGFQIDHRRPFLGESLPSADDVDRLVLCGGGINVDQEKKFPWLRTEKKLIEDVLRKNGKVLGLCLGGQLIAEVLGARVGPHIDWEVGWQPVDLHVHPGVAGFETPARRRFFQWHRYRFDLPAGSIRLASNDWWENQAFLWNHQALAFQFHPEAQIDWTEGLARDPEKPRTGRTQSAEEMIQLGGITQPSSRLWYERALEGFFF